MCSQRPWEVLSRHVTEARCGGWRTRGYPRGPNVLSVSWRAAIFEMTRSACDVSYFATIGMRQRPCFAKFLLPPGMRRKLKKVLMTYRADIDGLRALAVVPVVAFHAGLPAVGGGYVGVDIFFVISGYLITSIITSEIDAGHFSLATFYQRRVRRIFPALITVLIFCSIAGYLLMTPDDYKMLGQSAVATTLFVSNIFFWRQTNYFDAPVSENPLLHTWSLAIEEQFYLFYPLLLMLVARYWPNLRKPIIVILCLLSFVLGLWLLALKPSATFYLGPTRFWELLVGGLVAISLIPTSANKKTNLLVASFGLAMIGYAVFYYTAVTRFPGAAALLPVLGAAALIWSGSGEATAVHRLLGARPVVALGKASY